MTDSHQHRHPSVASIVGKAAFAVITAIILVGVLALICIVAPLRGLVDDADNSGAAGRYEVSTEQIEQYCAGRMALTDADAYGDSEFQASAGDIASSSRYAAFGSIYSSTIASMPIDMDTEPEALVSPSDDDGLFVASGTVDDGPYLFDTRLTASENGTGAVGSVASWATDGDLRGLAAASCVVPSLSQSFILPAAATGTTQQLVVSNPSDRATAVTLHVWGTHDGNPVSLTTGNTLTVDAQGENSVDLAVGAAGQDGLYVTVDSGETPVAAIVRMTRMDGLDPQGIDYVMPVGTESRHAVLPSVRTHDHVRLIARAEEATEITMSWLTTQESVQADTAHLEAGQVAVFDLGEAPDHVVGALVDSSVPVHAVAYVQRDGDDGQSDFAVINAGESATSSAVVTPPNMRGDLTLINTSSRQIEAAVHAYAADGSHVADQSVELAANAAVRVSLDDMDEEACIAVLDDPSARIVWGSRLTNSDVDDAGVSGVAVIGSTALTPMRQTVLSHENRAVIR